MTNKSKILIVDDEPMGRQLLEAIFMSDQYELEFANDGKIALNTAINVTPDLILLDVMMPEMDGFEVCRKIRSDEALKGIPVILVTALDDRDSRKRGLEAGANDYISKPFDRTEIEAKVKNLLQLNLTGNISVKAPPAVEQPNADELSYFINLLTESQRPLKSYIQSHIPEFFHIKSDKNGNENSIFWFATYENIIYMLFIESMIDKVDDKILKLLIISFLNRTIQSKQFETAADLVTKLNRFLSEKILLANHISNKEVSMSLSLVIIDKALELIHCSGFNQSTLFHNEVMLNKVDLDQIKSFPHVENFFNNCSFSLSAHTSIYFLNNLTLKGFGDNGYLNDENSTLKKYFSDLIPLSMKEQETSIGELFGNFGDYLNYKDSIELIGIRI